MSGVRAALCLAQEMGTGLGQRGLLFGAVSADKIGLGQRRREPHATLNHAPIITTPPIGVTAPSQRGAPSAKA